ncbi:hypothetical protein EON65_44455, partial [archaeon]
MVYGVRYTVYDVCVSCCRHITIIIHYHFSITLLGGSEILRLATLTKYSRLPVYRGDVDHIVGVVFSKDLLDFMTVPGMG